MELVLTIGGDKRDEKGLGVRKLAVGEEGREEREKAMRGSGEGGRVELEEPEKCEKGVGTGR